MNAAGDYSAAYCILHTDSDFSGHGMVSHNSNFPPSSPQMSADLCQTFTIGRGNEIVCQAISLLAARVEGKKLEDLVSNWGQTWRYLVSDSQLRWIGPEKGVIHLALGAVVNAIWDLWAKTLNKPVWRIVADMSPEEFVSCIDFRYITDAITKEEAIEMLKKEESGKAERIKHAEANRAVPAYTTSAGWLGYGKDKMKGLLQETLDAGYKHFKLKVGTSVAEDKERLSIAREVIGYDKGNFLMVDANQVWSVPEAIEYMKQLAEFKPWFIEEPTSPDDIFGHKAIREALKPYGIGVATGEMCQNRVIFKQLLQQGAIDVCQIDACRMGGVNEVLAVLLIAKKFGVPIVPHSGGVGLPEYTQHLSTIDYVVVSGKLSVLEYVDHLHEHFFNPSVIKDGYYTTPLEPGYSVEMKPESMDKFGYPGKEGVSWWKSEEARPILEGERI
jgi:L-galactonate dehydratase